MLSAHMIKTYERVLLTARAIAGVRFQEASIDELEVRFQRVDILSLALRLQGESKDRRDQNANEAQSDCKLVKRVTRDQY